METEEEIRSKIDAAIGNNEKRTFKKWIAKHWVGVVYMLIFLFLVYRTFFSKSYEDGCRDGYSAGYKEAIQFSIKEFTKPDIYQSDSIIIYPDTITAKKHEKSLGISL